VSLIQIDVIHDEALQAVVDCAHDRFAGQTAAIGSLAPGIENLGGDDDFVPPAKVADGAAEKLLAGAIGVAICRIEEINAEFQSALDKGAARLLV